MTVHQNTDATKAICLQREALQRKPLQRNHSLDAKFRSWKVNPHIGTEFETGVQIRDILRSPNTDELIQDLAVLVAERNVAFFRNQDLTFDEQKELADRLGRAAGKPSESSLHSHPISDESSEFGDKNYAISSELDKKLGTLLALNTSELHRTYWHSDITFENFPSDYAVLRLREVPPEGGDTLWASAYEVYDRLSPAFQRFLEGLTATHSGDGFLNLQARGLTNINPGPRGNPENVGTHLTAVHPLVRTNPVTGWKGVFANSEFTKRINELSKDESDWLLKHLADLTIQNHDLQVRFKWNKHDVAVWDNRSSFHSATYDYDADEFVRLGERSASVGEKPYFDVASTSRRQALGIAPPVARRSHLASLAKLHE
ncbi:alpha-ketoglutarate-dependent taurine dioxygenase [Chytriomyces sp. MP71]|nr:alpha-ketoglutarate-dependent taurine dioxygenase [Chytriomyces sp. MP71]